MSSYYPEGVSGFEDEIAGPADEYESTELVGCGDCTFYGEVDVQVTVWGSYEDRAWKCPWCEYENATEK